MARFYHKAAISASHLVQQHRHIYGGAAGETREGTSGGATGGTSTVTTGVVLCGSTQGEAVRPP